MWVFPSKASASSHREGMRHLRARIGEAGGAKFRFYALHNGFGAWSRDGVIAHSPVG